MKAIHKKLFLLFLCLLFFIILGGCNSKKDVIKIAADNTSEEFVITEIICALIDENTNLKVEVTKGLSGGTSIIHPAMLKGEFDMYPEYTGTAWAYVLKRTDIPKREVLNAELRKIYKEKFDFEWVGLYGFNNSYGLMIQKDLAEKYDITSYSDLAKFPDEFAFGAEYDFFERDDGYDALCSTYGIKFKKYMDINFSLKYHALEAKEVDVINIFTTDGRLSVVDGVVLRDDKHFFPEYLCGTVVRGETLIKYPELREVLMIMDGLISDKEMSDLNYQTQVLNRDEKEVAMEFLAKKGLID